MAKSKTETPNTGKLLSVPDIAERCGVAPKTVWRWLQERKLSCFRPGKRVLVSEEQLATFLAKSEVQAIDPKELACRILGGDA